LPAGILKNVLTAVAAATVVLVVFGVAHALFRAFITFVFVSIQIQTNFQPTMSRVCVCV